MNIIESAGYKIATFSQKNLRWRWQKLGTCNVTIGSHGCKNTTMAMMMGGTEIKNPKGYMSVINPSILDWVATFLEKYTNGCLIADSIWCKWLGLEYDGRHKEPPKYPCVAETNYYASSGIPQHFFVYLPNGNIIDPLNFPAKETWNKYHKNMVSYRWIKPKVKVEVKCAHCCPVHC